MDKKQLIALFICMLVPFTIGNGLLPLMPIYAIQTGASPAFAGYYLGFTYLSLAAGTFAAGWLSDRFQRRKEMLILSGLVVFPLVWMMGRVTSIYQLAVLSSLTWFLGGIQVTVINILAGLFANPQTRGRVFGILSLTGGLGALIGGVASGQIEDRWGFSVLFSVVAVFGLLLPLMSYLLEDQKIEPAPAGSSGPEAPAGGAKLEAGFYILMLASITAGTSIFTGRLGTSLTMNEMLFSSAAISSTGAVGGLVTLPLSPYIGTLSDRLGRKRMLAICYLSGALGIGLLAAAVDLWHFWLGASLISVLAYVSTGVSSAFVTDLVPREALGRGMSYFSATTWIGGIVGFSASGLAFERFGLEQTFLMAALLPVIGALLLIPVGRKRRALVEGVS